MKRIILIALAAVALFALVACGGGGSETVNVTIKAEDIKYSVTTIEAKVGQKVTVTLDNVGALEHNFIIPDLNVEMKMVAPSSKGTLSFTPTKAGEFEFNCNVAGHKEAGMVGKLIVTP